VGGLVSRVDLIVKGSTGPGERGRAQFIILYHVNMPPLPPHGTRRLTYPVASAPRARRAVRLLVLELLRIMGMASAGWLVLNGRVGIVHQQIEDALTDLDAARTCAAARAGGLRVYDPVVWCGVVLI
jgi:hypothetical protein